MPRVAVRPHVDEQGIRRRAQPDRAEGTGDALGLRRSRIRGWHPGIISIDQSTHSLFGASKVAADVMVQEYGRYFNMPTCCLRGGCLTGPNHTGVELHGFLSYLVKCNLERDASTGFSATRASRCATTFIARTSRRSSMRSAKAPRAGEVYNLGGGKANSCSILEAFSLVESMTGKTQIYRYVDQAPRSAITSATTATSRKMRGATIRRGISRRRSTIRFVKSSRSGWNA